MADRLAADAAGIARAAELLRSGQLVAFPTDTVYGIGCRIGDAAALVRVFAAKRRDPEKAVAWLVATSDTVADSGFRVDDRAAQLAERFWPGALTLVLPALGGPATQAFLHTTWPWPSWLPRDLWPCRAPTDRGSRKRLTRTTSRLHSPIPISPWRSWTEDGCRGALPRPCST
jgi:hypothetical protein